MTLSITTTHIHPYTSFTKHGHTLFGSRYKWCSEIAKEQKIYKKLYVPRTGRQEEVSESEKRRTEEIRKL